MFQFQTRIQAEIVYDKRKGMEFDQKNSRDSDSLDE